MSICFVTAIVCVLSLLYPTKRKVTISTPNFSYLDFIFPPRRSGNPVVRSLVVVGPYKDYVFRVKIKTVVSSVSFTRKTSTEGEEGVCSSVTSIMEFLFDPQVVSYN